MTAQFSESLKYKNEVYGMCSEPLTIYIAQNNLAFRSESTANWRGYVGDWEIMGDDHIGYRLYMIGISANDLDGKKLKLKDLFPETPKGVFAHWFSGEIRCPLGKQLKYVHMGYSSIYEQDLFLKFEKGVLIKERLVKNKPLPVKEYKAENTAWFLWAAGKKK